METDNAQIIISILAILVPIAFAAIGWLFKVLWDLKTNRQRIIWIDNTSLTPFKLPLTKPDKLWLEFKGRRLNSIYQNKFVISNQSFETITQIKIVLNLGTEGKIIHVKTEDKVSTRVSEAYIVGSNRVIVKIDYLNSMPILKDKYEIFVSSDEPITKITVSGGGQGWIAKYRGAIQEGPVVVPFPSARTFIAIDGPIGVGKTTLVKLLQKTWNTDILLEKVEEPFLKNFYNDRQSQAFQTQLHFLLDRFDELKEKRVDSKPLVSDYFFDKDRIFAEINLEGKLLRRYYNVFNSLRKEVIQPDFIIYLKADIDILMERINKRGRKSEENMDRDYMEKLSKKYEEFFKSYGDSPVLPIDTTTLDLANNEQDCQKVLELIKSTFSGK